MFTGIITNLGVLKQIISTPNQDTLITILLNLPLNHNEKQARNLEIGCSIACNGICLTLIKKNQIEDQKFVAAKTRQQWLQQKTKNSLL